MEQSYRPLLLEKGYINKRLNFEQIEFLKTDNVCIAKVSDEVLKANPLGTEFTGKPTIFGTLFTDHESRNNYSFYIPRYLDVPLLYNVPLDRGNPCVPNAETI